MSIHDYFPGKFFSDVERLPSHPLNSLLRQSAVESGFDPEARFFGGKDWKNCARDLAGIENKSHFVSCGFALFCTDLNIQLAFPHAWLSYRAVAAMPLLGWQDFRPRYEAPEKLIDVPLQLGMFELKDTDPAGLAHVWLWWLRHCFNAGDVPVPLSGFLGTLLRRHVFHQNLPHAGDFFIRLRQKMEEVAGVL